MLVHGRNRQPHRQLTLHGGNPQLRSVLLLTGYPCVPGLQQITGQCPKAEQAAPLAGHPLGRLMGNHRSIPDAAGVDVVLHGYIEIPALDRHVDSVHVICVAAIRLPAALFRNQQKQEQPLLVSQGPQTRRLQISQRIMP